MELDEEPEDTLVEPDREIMALMSQASTSQAEGQSKKDDKVEIPDHSEVPQGMMAVVGKKILTSKATFKKKGKGQKIVHSPMKSPWHLLTEDLNNLGIEELRKRLLIQEIKRSISERVWYDHATTVIGPLKNFLASMPSTFIPGMGEGDHDYSSRDTDATQMPQKKKSKTCNHVSVQTGQENVSGSELN